MKKKWTKRKLQTVKFKGREPRALLWRKPVYEEWFHYAKLAQSMGKKIPRAFGNLRKFDNFDDWWRDERYGFELFCEKPTGELVSEATSKTKLEPDEILVKINLKGDLEIINSAVRRLLVSKDVNDEYTSNARFQPSRPMKHIAVGATDTEFEEGVKRQNKLGEYRETYEVVKSVDGDYKEAAKKLGWLLEKDFYVSRKLIDEDDVYGYQHIVDNRVKKVRRHVDQVEAIFQSIANNTFP